MWKFGIYVCVWLVIATYGLGDVITAPRWKLNDGNEIPSLALGTWLGHNAQGRVKPKLDEVERAVTAAVELGYRHVDTAYIYMIENQVGRAITKKLSDGVPREDLFITTKLWNDRHAKDDVVPALRGSLKTLNLTYVDLYLIHWPVGQFANQTFDDTDYLDTWRGMVEAKRLGLTRSIGLSNFNQDQIARIIDAGLQTPAVLQVEINLNLQQPELLQYCNSKGIVVMGYTPFGSLFHSKAKPDAPPPRVDDAELLAIANRYNKTVTQVTLRYLLDLGVIPIPKALGFEHLSANIAVFDFELSSEDRAKIKTYDTGYRTLPQLKWVTHRYYPFEKKL